MDLLGPASSCPAPGGLRISKSPIIRAGPATAVGWRVPSDGTLPVVLLPLALTATFRPKIGTEMMLLVGVSAPIAGTCAAVQRVGRETRSCARSRQGRVLQWC